MSNCAGLKHWGKDNMSCGWDTSKMDKQRFGIASVGQHVFYSPLLLNANSLRVLKKLLPVNWGQ